MGLQLPTSTGESPRISEPAPNSMLRVASGLQYIQRPNDSLPVITPGTLQSSPSLRERLRFFGRERDRSVITLTSFTACFAPTKLVICFIKLKERLKV